MLGVLVTALTTYFYICIWGGIGVIMVSMILTFWLMNRIE